MSGRAARLGVLAVVLLLGAVALGGLAVSRLGGGGTAAALGPPHFVEESAAAGVDHTYDGGPSFFAGGGVATFDCNGDGRPDLYLAGGSRPAALYRDDSPVGGVLRFTHLSDPATDLADVNGAYPLDIDGDGLVDLAVLRVGGTVLLRGLGDCRFAHADEAWSFAQAGSWTTAFSATWEGSARLPTLAIGNYLGLDPAGKPTSTCADNALFRPDAAGTGYAAPLTLTPGYCTLSILFSDWDRSGRRDLRVSNDRQYYVDGEEQLWRMGAGEPPRLYTADQGWVRMQIWGMGIASYDVTGDGFPDVFLTSQGDNKLQTLTAGPARPTYRDIALKRGVTAAQPFTGGDDLPSTAWHPEFQDVNNDGFVDLFISKGNVSAMPDYAQRDPSDLLLGQPDGTFHQAAEGAGILSFSRGRGAALADFNLDGLLDLVLVNYGDAVKLWRNVGSSHPSGASGSAGQATAGGSSAAMGNWIAVRPTEPGPNRDAIGGWIDVKAGDRTLQRELTVGGGHVSGSLGWIHFGLGDAPDAQVRVTWPDGTAGPWLPMAANRFGIVERGASEVRPWQPPGD
jgi:enediyne biosynthesis protein E4